MKQTNRKGFTLAELLIVVAIIAVLVAIAIPVFTKQLHNVRVAADVANVRAYYAELQADYMETGVQNPSVVDSTIPGFDFYTIKFLNGDTVKLKAGAYQFYYLDSGYRFAYNCKDYTEHPEHIYTFGK